MSTCINGCTPACTCRYLTQAESRKFWRTIWIGAVANITLVVLILWAAKNGWIE